MVDETKSSARSSNEGEFYRTRRPIKTKTMRSALIVQHNTTINEILLCTDKRLTITIMYHCTVSCWARKSPTHRRLHAATLRTKIVTAGKNRALLRRYASSFTDTTIMILKIRQNNRQPKSPSAITRV